MKLKTNKVDLSQKLKGMMSVSAIYGISHAECAQMVSAAGAKLDYSAITCMYLQCKCAKSTP